MKQLFNCKLLAATLIAVMTSMPTYAQNKEFRIGTGPWIGNGPFYVAVEMKMFEKQGVNVKIQDFADPSILNSALAGGSIQASMSTYDQVISSNANGQKFKVVMPVDFSNGADAIVAENSIKTIADLKGKKVAYPFSSIDNLLVVFALNKVGLKETDIQSVDTAPENVPSALLGGAVAGATYEPTISKILKMGNGKKYHVLMTSKEAPGLLTDVLYMDKAYIDKNPDTIRAVIKGYLDGLQYIKDQPVAARKIIAKYLSSTEAEVKEQQAGVYNIPAAEMAGYFVKKNDSKNDSKSDSNSLYKTADLVSTILIARGQIKTPTKAEDTLDNRFVLELQTVAKK